MKKVFFGLAVAAVALSASAFTNAKTITSRLTSVWVTTYDVGNDAYNFQNNSSGIICVSEAPRPCKVNLAPGYTPPGGQIPASDLDVSGKTTVISKRDF